MAGNTLQGKRVAILATDGVEQEELTQPKAALEDAGATTIVVSPKETTLKTWKDGNWGAEIAVDLPLESAHAEEFDALLLPGGVKNPDTLRMEPQAVAFVKAFFDLDKPVAAICHAPWLLVEADVVEGRTITSWPSLKTDILNAGGEWVDREVANDRGLVTSRKPEDIPAFTAKMIEEFAEGRHAGEKRPAKQRARRARDRDRASL
jgi:protease I